MDPHCIWFNKKLISWSELRCDDVDDSGKKSGITITTVTVEVVTPEIMDKPRGMYQEKKPYCAKHETAGNCYLASLMSE